MQVIVYKRQLFINCKTCLCDRNDWEPPLYRVVYELRVENRLKNVFSCRFRAMRTWLGSGWQWAFLAPELSHLKVTPPCVSGTASCVRPLLLVPNPKSFKGWTTRNFLRTSQSGCLMRASVTAVRRPWQCRRRKSPSMPSTKHPSTTKVRHHLYQ